MSGSRPGDPPSSRLRRSSIARGDPRAESGATDGGLVPAPSGVGLDDLLRELRRVIGATGRPIELVTDGLDDETPGPSATFRRGTACSGS